jgi:hypothetical protein
VIFYTMVAFVEVGADVVAAGAIVDAFGEFSGF